MSIDINISIDLPGDPLRGQRYGHPSVEDVFGGGGAFSFRVYDGGTMRYWYSIPHASVSLHGESPVYKGDWSSGTSYVLNNVVKIDTNLYTCIVTHTSSLSTKPGEGGSWSDYWVKSFENAGTYKGKWKYGENYSKGDIVCGWTIYNADTATPSGWSRTDTAERGVAVCIHDITGQTFAERFGTDKWAYATPGADSWLGENSAAFGKLVDDFNNPSPNCQRFCIQNPAGSGSWQSLWTSILGNEYTTMCQRRASWCGEYVFEARPGGYLQRRYFSAESHDVIELHYLDGSLKRKQLMICIKTHEQPPVPWPYEILSYRAPSAPSRAYWSEPAVWFDAPFLRSDSSSQINDLGSFQYESAGSQATQPNGIWFGTHLVHETRKHYFVSNDFLPSASSISSEFAEPAEGEYDTRWDRLPLEIYGGDSTKTERLHEVGKESEYVIRVRVKKANWTKVDVTPDMKAAEDDSGGAELITDTDIWGDDNTMGYSVSRVSRGEYHLEVREIGSQARMVHTAATGINADNPVRRNSWISPQGLFFEGFDTADTDNYKVTREPTYGSEAVDAGFLRAMGKNDISVYLMPRRWASYAKAVYSSKNHDDYDLDTEWTETNSDTKCITKSTTRFWQDPTCYPVLVGYNVFPHWNAFDTRSDLWAEIKALVPPGTQVACAEGPYGDETKHSPQIYYEHSDASGNTIIKYITCTDGCVLGVTLPRASSSYRRDYWHETDSPTGSNVVVCVAGGPCTGAACTDVVEGMPFFRFCWNARREGYHSVHGIFYHRAPFNFIGRGYYITETGWIKGEQTTSTLAGCGPSAVQQTAPSYYGSLDLATARSWEKNAQGWDDERTEEEIVSGATVPLLFSVGQTDGALKDYMDDSPSVTSKLLLGGVGDPSPDLKTYFYQNGLWLALSLNSYQPGETIYQYEPARKSASAALCVAPSKAGMLVAVVKVGTTPYYIWRVKDEEFDVFGKNSDGSNWTGEHVGFVKNNTSDFGWYDCDQGFTSSEWKIDKVGVVPSIEYTSKSEYACDYPEEDPQGECGYHNTVGPYYNCMNTVGENYCEPAVTDIYKRGGSVGVSVVRGTSGLFSLERPVYVIARSSIADGWYESGYMEYISTSKCS